MGIDAPTNRTSAWMKLKSWSAKTKQVLQAEVLVDT